MKGLVSRLASQVLPSSFFSHSSYFGRTSFFFVATTALLSGWARRRSISWRLLWHSHDVSLMSSAATLSKLGENHFPYVLATCVNLRIGRFMPLFCVAMAWSSTHKGPRPVVMYVNEWRSSQWADKKECSCSFLVRDKEKLPSSVSLALLLIWGACTCWCRQSLP